MKLRVVSMQICMDTEPTGFLPRLTRSTAFAPTTTKSASTLSAYRTTDSAVVSLRCFSSSLKCVFRSWNLEKTC
eukprot:CAMPEP_0197917860 /NCGR_PEP_ID=MMETSP1439-20131203/84473_1 /TAXON_ID=66791 /ORGANISM="Gonyaulax spinifera, Strain CCMP409" /LENGTH=73 /DNA_ID=CAMNT_0043539949 /DNA_START=36 /DNA_END=254 /DNA_ORIENTATION=-